MHAGQKSALKLHLLSHEGISRSKRTWWRVRESLLLMSQALPGCPLLLIHVMRGLHHMPAMSLTSSLDSLSHEAWECKPQEYAGRTSHSSTCCQCFSVSVRCRSPKLHIKPVAHAGHESALVTCTR